MIQMSLKKANLYVFCFNVYDYWQ